jgi:hypothetical protein
MVEEKAWRPNKISSLQRNLMFLTPHATLLDNTETQEQKWILPRVQVAIDAENIKNNSGYKQSRDG